jgi:hypothetical protein
MPNVHRAVRLFNSFFSGFLRDIKDIDERFRKAIKASYSVIDKASPTYCDYFKEHVYESFPELVAENFENEKLLPLNVCQGISVHDIFSCCTEKQQKDMAINYLLILTLFAYLSCEDDEPSGDNCDIIKQSVDLLSMIQRGEVEAYEAGIEDVFDDVLVGILNAIRKYGGKTRVDSDKISQAAEYVPEAPEAPESPECDGDDDEGAGDASFDPMNMFEKLNNSKIADLAKEISKDIDVSALKADNPDEILKNLFSGNGENNVLGNIISKVSTSLTDKISKGEIKHEELLSEAMSMMNMFGPNKGGKGKGGAMNPADILGNFADNPMLSPMFSQFAKAMKGGKAAVRQDVLKKASARDRLRKKLEEKKASRVSESS